MDITKSTRNYKRAKDLFIQGVALVYVNPKLGNSTGEDLQKFMEQNFRNPTNNQDIPTPFCIFFFFCYTNLRRKVINRSFYVMIR